MKAIQKKMTSIGRGGGTSTRPPLPTKGGSKQRDQQQPPAPAPSPSPPQQQSKEEEGAAAAATAGQAEQEQPQGQQEEGAAPLTVDVPSGAAGEAGAGSSSSSSESSYFVFSPSPTPHASQPQSTAGTGSAESGSSSMTKLAGVVFGDEGYFDAAAGGGPGTGIATAQVCVVWIFLGCRARVCFDVYDTIGFDQSTHQLNKPRITHMHTHALMQASLGIAERIAGFLSLGDLAAYFGLDELGGKVRPWVCFVSRACVCVYVRTWTFMNVTEGGNGSQGVHIPW